MIYNFSERKGQKDFLETELLKLKKEYKKPHMSEQQINQLKAVIKNADIEQEKCKKKTGIFKCTVAAAFVAGFLVLPNMSSTLAYAMKQIPVIGQLMEAVTFRDYTYESNKNTADIKVPGIQLDGQLKDSKQQENLEHTANEINAEIQQITDTIVKDFEDNLKNEDGYQNVMVDSEVVATTADHFTLKLSCYQAAGSGYQFNYYYTVDLNTGERLRLKDIFRDGADYITPISMEIKKQMKEQMDVDKNAMYWLDNEIEEWNFEHISEETLFYLNENGQVVISFNEGEVAPMYMGVVEFKIPEDVLSEIRK